LKRVISKWLTGETVADGIESWHEFCLRVERGIAQMLREAPPAASAVIFTSARPIGATGRQVLHLFAEDTLHLSWMSRNASFSDFRASGHRRMLSAFNAHPHLDEDSVLTYR
jgi:broad specificity phosphatase PhoE